MISKNKIDECAGAVAQKLLRRSKSALLTKQPTNRPTNQQTDQPTNELTKWGIMLSTCLTLPYALVIILDLNVLEKKMLTT